MKVKNHKPILENHAAGLIGIETCYFPLRSPSGGKRVCGGYTIAAQRIGRKVMMSIHKFEENRAYDENEGITMAIGRLMTMGKLLTDPRCFKTDLIVYTNDGFDLKKTIISSILLRQHKRLPALFAEFRADFPRIFPKMKKVFNTN